MAKKDNKPNIRFGALKRIANLMQSNTDNLYKNTYFSDPSNKQQLIDLKSGIDDTIRDIMNTNIDNVGEPNMSRMYERLYMSSQNDKHTNDEFRRIFEDNEYIAELTNSYLDTRNIQAQDAEIDQVFRYMPKLEEAIQTLRDNVLSSDSFSKDFLNITDTLDQDNDIIFSNNIEEMKNNYKLLDLINEIYYNTSKYGETFVYIVPYDKAIQKLLDRKQSNVSNIGIVSNFKEHKVVMESASETNIIDPSSVIGSMEEANDLQFNFELDTSCIIDSIVEEEYSARTKFTKLNEQSLCEQALNEATSIDEVNKKVHMTKTMDMDLENPSKLPVHHKFDRTIDDDLELPKDDDITADGLYTKQSKSTRIKNINGCIVKILKRERVKPIILNDICLGYYYFEYDDRGDLFNNNAKTSYGLNNSINGLYGNGRAEGYNETDSKEKLLQYLAGELSEKIDATFVNANQDLKREIYYILKYNDDFTNNTDQPNNIRVTYIPPEDIHHIYFNLDKETGRGISDVAMSLIPAKLWVSIYLTNCIGVMTRSNDKRVYYVKQSVESNISKTLLKTINEIKKSNFGMRQIESINNVLNITGRFNDYIIPRGADGSSPIEFEVMQGQQIEIKTELLNILEESAINVTGVPIELIQNRQSPDYAVQLTMQNSKFLRYVYGRQSKFQDVISKLCTRIYNLEYGNNNKIKVTLPPPLFINMMNTTQLITNTNDYAEQVTNIVLADETNDTVKTIFAKKYKIYNLGSYLNMNVIEDLIDASRQEATLNQIESGEEV